MVRQQRKAKVQTTTESRTSFVWDVFLSHSSIDKRAARKLAGRLRQQGLTVWFDEDQIGPGDPILQRVNHGLSNSRRLVLLVTTSASSSRWCEAEVDSLMSSQIVSAMNRVVLAHHRPLHEAQVAPLLRQLHRVDISSISGVRHLTERLRQPISAEEYCANIRAKPLLASAFSNSPYHVEPSEFVPVVLGEVAFQYGGPVRAIRTSDPAISLPDFNSLLTSGGAGRVVVLLGEAGIGKTTLCRLLCRQLADVKHEKSFLPIYLSLGEWDSKAASLEQLLDRELGFCTIQSLLSGPSFKGRLVLFLDGLNEQDPDSLASVFSFARRVVVSHRATVVLTTRLVADATQMPVIDDLRFLEIRRWTPQQLESYFAKNHRSESLLQVPSEVRNSLRLPLLASLVLRRMLQEDRPPRLQAVADVFEYILGQFAQGISAASKARAIKGRPRIEQPVLRDGLRELALRMTQKRVVQAPGKLLEDCLPTRSKATFRVVMAHAVNGGLLRCSDSMVALDPESNTSELRRLKISFLHQSVQEYMAAQRLQASPKSPLPANVSHDAFWRDIPLYLTHCLSHDRERVRSFVLAFLQTGSPDFLTACRLLHEIEDRALQAEIRQLVISGLVGSMESAFYYPYSIEAFHELGATGIETLRNCAGGAAILRTVYAESEAHVIGLPPSEAMETQWRRTARAIYMLGELGDMEFMVRLGHEISRIRSRHLLYHIGEALLTLCTRQTLSGTVSQRFLKMSRVLCGLPNADPVIKALAQSASRALGSRLGLRNATSDLLVFLSACVQDDSPHFRQEYWCRAHGVEALAEIGRVEDCIGVFGNIHATEDLADYGAYQDGDYRKVQSSILKAVTRSCDAYPNSRHQWFPLLEAMFQSARVAENGWACSHLESLLLKNFADEKSLAWIKRWKESGELGGSLIDHALANVLWFTS